MRPVFFKLFDIATQHAFSEQAAKVGSIYSEDQIKKLKSIYDDALGVEEGDFEENICEQLFGVQSKLIYEVFLEKVTTEVKWIFKAAELRKLLFQVANIETKHIKSG